MFIEQNNTYLGWWCLWRRTLGERPRQAAVGSVRAPAWSLLAAPAPASPSAHHHPLAPHHASPTPVTTATSFQCALLSPQSVTLLYINSKITALSKTQQTDHTTKWFYFVLLVISWVGIEKQKCDLRVSEFASYLKCFIIKQLRSRLSLYNYGLRIWPLVAWYEATLRSKINSSMISNKAVGSSIWLKLWTTFRRLYSYS